VLHSVMPIVSDIADNQTHCAPCTRAGCVSCAVMLVSISLSAGLLDSDGARHWPCDFIFIFYFSKNCAMLRHLSSLVCRTEYFQNVPQNELLHTLLLFIVSAVTSINKSSSLTIGMYYMLLPRFAPSSPSTNPAIVSRPAALQA